ncbi:MAG: stage III sporulation protein AB [Clostridia bacterium]|nr:stage III sporulation protein AB [Clostridia bacterium]
MSLFVKALAALFTVAGTVIIGSTESEKLKRRLEYNEEIISDVERLRDEIEQFRAPLPETVERISQTGGSFFKELYCNMSDKRTVQSSVRQALEMAEFTKKTDSDQTRLIKELFQRLGNGGVAEQKTVIDDFLLNYRKTTETVREKAYKGKKLYKMLGAAAGLSLYILLI